MSERRALLELVDGYCRRMLDEGQGCFASRDADDENITPVPTYIGTVDALGASFSSFLTTQPAEGPHADTVKELDAAIDTCRSDIAVLEKTIADQRTEYTDQKPTNGELKKAVDRLAMAYDRYYLDIRGKLLPFAPQTALAAAEVFRWASWFLVQRAETPQEVEKMLTLSVR